MQFPQENHQCILSSWNHVGYRPTRTCASNASVYLSVLYKKVRVKRTLKQDGHKKATTSQRHGHFKIGCMSDFSHFFTTGGYIMLFLRLHANDCMFLHHSLFLSSLGSKCDYSTKCADTRFQQVQAIMPASLRPMRSSRKHCPGVRVLVSMQSLRAPPLAVLMDGQDSIQSLFAIFKTAEETCRLLEIR